MLTRFQIKNYRGIEDIDVPLDWLTAFVGPNGTGKTTILNALNVVLGEAWPSLRSFRVPQDFCSFETTREIELTVSFDPFYIHRDMLGNNHEITALRVNCRPYRKSGQWGNVGDLHVEFEPLGRNGDVPMVAITSPAKGQRPQFRHLTIGADLKEHARILFIDHRRAINQHLPWVRGSVLGKLLQKARKIFMKDTERVKDFKEAYERAMDILRIQEVHEVEQRIADTAKRMIGFLGRNAVSEVDIRFGFADPANPLNSLRVEYSEAGQVIPGDELGLGVQSAIVVGIFEAFRAIEGNLGMVVIEEPEMYLHPQAQRYFYKLLCEMADKRQCQVIYSTHSPIFADVSRFEALRLVRKEVKRFTGVSYVDALAIPNLKAARDKLKIGGRFNPARNEVLFANRALLVEGYGDQQAALMVAEKLGHDPDSEGVAVTDCGGKTGIELVARICKALSIPFLVFHDEDVWDVAKAKDPKKQEQENEQAQKENERIRAIVTQEALFVVSPTLEERLGIGRSASDKPLRVVEALEPLSIDQIPPELVRAVKATFDS